MWGVRGLSCRHVLMAGSAFDLLSDSCRGRLGCLRVVPPLPPLTVLTADVTLLIGARFGLAAPLLEGLFEGELLGGPGWSPRSFL